MPDILNGEGGDTVTKIKFTPSITLGNLISLGTIFAIVAIWAITTAGKTDVAVQKINDLRSDMTAQLTAIQSQISSLPTEAAAINVLQQHAGQTDQAIGVINSEIRDLTTQAIQNKAEIDNIERASSIPLKHR